MEETARNMDMMNSDKNSMVLIDSNKYQVLKREGKIKDKHLLDHIFEQHGNGLDKRQMMLNIKKVSILVIRFAFSQGIV